MQDRGLAAYIAELIGTLAERLEARSVSPGLAYLTADSLVETPLAQAFRVRETLPLDERRIAQRLRELGIGELEIKKRGADIDPAALTSSQDNAEANRVQLNVGSPERAQGEYPLVVANILASPLKLLAPLLCAHVAPGGDLILAGILSRQAEELQAAYAPWLSLQVADEEDGWILMTARRPVQA